MAESKPAPRNHIRVFVASTVYNFQFELNAIYNYLDNLGYDVYMSHKGTILLDSRESNLKNCTNGVEECDVFVGFIRPDYGSGVLDEGGKSILHLEFEAAYKRDIPRFVLADHRVVFTRALFKGSFFIEDKTSQKIDFDKISFENNKVLDTRTIRMYNMAVKDKDKPASKRKGNWVQEYVNHDDILLHLESQFRYPDRIKKLIERK
jgi:hypothetical protein